jgi:class 3 adenylate cyclase
MERDGVERKLAAILNADVVGYSRLMAEDEAGTIRTLGAYRDEIRLLVDQHRGRIADFTGDNFLAEFPTALDAVEAAVEIQRVLEARNAGRPEERRMEFRIGIHLGDVATDGERLYGNGVNIAARLQGLAEAGGICISGTVRDVVRGKLDLPCEDLGEQSVKNIPGSVRVFRLVTRDRAPSRQERGVGEARIKYAVRPDRARIAYAVMGAGPVLVMPPGGSTNIEWYLRDTAAHEVFCSRLAKHRTLVMYDRHGFGLSDRNRTDFTEENEMLDLEAVIDALDRPKVDFFGISWGGIPSVAYAARHPDAVRRMVLYGTYATGRAQASAEWQARDAALRSLRQTDRELYTKAMASQYFPSGTDRETFQSLARMLYESTTPEVEEQLAGGELDNQSELPGISTPALVIHRRGDQAVPFEWGQYLARRLGNASFLPLDGDAHFPWVDDANSVLGPTIEFLTEGEDQ